jgi:hypothetical protein
VGGGEARETGSEKGRRERPAGSPAKHMRGLSFAPPHDEAILWASNITLGFMKGLLDTIGQPTLFFIWLHNMIQNFIFLIYFYSLCKNILPFQNLAKLTYHCRGPWR